MTTTSGPSDYRSPSGEHAAHTEGIMDEVSDRVSTLTSDVVNAMEERPYTSLAIAGGLAFAIGALWVLKRQQQQKFVRAAAFTAAVIFRRWRLVTSALAV